MTFMPEIIFLDLGLPKVSGYDVCRAIRKQPGGENMLIFAVTGWGQDEDRTKSKEAGFNAHLVKPVEYAVLRTLMDSVGWWSEKKQDGSKEPSCR
jgi:CheY-like chemotaxis protein